MPPDPLIRAIAGYKGFRKGEGVEGWALKIGGGESFLKKITVYRGA